MPIEVKMPQMGESIAEGTLVKWHKKVGDRVKRDEPLFEISTDKVDTEVPSPADGFLLRVDVNEGETVPVRSVVCVLGETQTAGDGGPAPPKATVTPGAEKPSRGAAPPRRDSDPGARQRSSPLVRRLAEEHGIDISRLEGTGTGGRVTKEDILQAVERGGRAASRPRVPQEGEAGDRVEPMSPMRERIAEHMIASRRTSAHVTSVFEVDMTAVRGLKDSLQREAEKAGAKLTYMPFVAHAITENLRRFPALNASIEGKNVRYHERIHMGVAVALEDGLIVPVVTDAGDRSIVDLARAMADLAARARSKALKPEEVRGGTFTITNPGVFGSLIGTPIIHQPQVAILCVGAVEKRPVVLPGTDAIAIRSMAYLSLSYDHRLIDGATADRFMAGVKASLESGSVDEALRDISSPVRGRGSVPEEARRGQA